MRSEMEQLKILLADLNSEAAKRSASQPTCTFTVVAATSPVSGGKTQHAEIGNKHKALSLRRAFQARHDPYYPSVIGTDAPPSQSCEVGGPDRQQLIRKVGRIGTGLHSAGGLQAAGCMSDVCNPAQPWMTTWPFSEETKSSSRTVRNCLHEEGIRLSKQGYPTGHAK
jgi:hypothetical protein